MGGVLMWGLRDYEHRLAVNALEARTYNGVDPLRTSAYPTMVDPIHWYGVIETPAFFALPSVDSLGPEVDPEGRMDIRYKPEETPITLAAKKSYAGRAFLDWAQYPITETEVLEPPEEGYIVHFQDLRYAQLPNMFGRNRGSCPLCVGVKLGKDLHVVGDVYETRKGRVVVPDPDQH